MRRHLLIASTALAAGLTTLAPVGPAAAAGTTPSFHPYAAHPTGSWPEGVATGDVTGDGRPDVVMTTGYYFEPGADFGLWVFPQQADGTLGAPTRHATRATYGSSMAVTVADLDGDQDLDVGVSTDEGIEIFAQDQGTLAYSWTAPAPEARDAEAVDVSGDGLADLVVNTATGITVLWQINGDFMHAPTGPKLSGGSVTEIEVADVTGDGLADVVAAEGSAVTIRAQRADHSFGAPVSHHSGGLGGWDRVNGIGVGDLDDDGLGDVVASVGGNRPNAWVATRLQQPDGTLGPATLRTSHDIPESIDVADVTADGRDDVVVVHGGWNRVGVLAQDAPGTMPSAEELFEIPYATHYAPKGLAVADFTGDGLPDIAIADYNNGLVTLRAATPDADTTAPATAITSGPSGTHRSRTATLAFTADEPATFECALDGDPTWQPCTSPVTYDGLSAGAHTVHVRATDSAGNTDPTPAQRTFVVDGPETTITSGPSGTIRSTSATFGFTATAATGFQCQLDVLAWAPCTSPATYDGLETGRSHTFRVRAANAEGLVDSTPATRTFSVDSPADLAVALSATPDPVRRGETLTWTVSVTNTGSGPAAGVVLTQSLPAGVDRPSVGTDALGGTCTVSGSPAIVRCQLGTLAPGATAVVTVRAVVTERKGTLASTAVAGTTSWEQNTSDDSASVTTSIGGRGKG